MPVIKAGTSNDGNVEGADYGASASLILDQSDPGQGPRLHRHPYDETWVVQDGHVTFQRGDERLAVEAGDIVIIPPGAAHKFTNNGPGRSELVCIHATRPSSANGLSDRLRCVPEDAAPLLPVPEVFDHPEHGLVGLHVMYLKLR